MRRTHKTVRIAKSFYDVGTGSLRARNDTYFTSPGPYSTLAMNDAVCTKVVLESCIVVGYIYPEYFVLKTKM